MSCLQLYSWSDCLWICFNTVLHRAVFNGLNFHCFLLPSFCFFPGRVQGKSADLFPDQQLGIEPWFSNECRKLSVSYFQWFWKLVLLWFEIGWVAKLVGDWFGFGFTTLNWKPLIFLGNLTLLVSLLFPRDNNHTNLTHINTNHSYLIVTSCNPEKHTLCHYSQST